MLNDFLQEIYKTLLFIKRFSKDNPDLSKTLILTHYTKVNKYGYRKIVPNQNDLISMDKLISQRLDDTFKFFNWYNEDIKAANIKLRKYILKYIEKREKLSNQSQIDDLNRFLIKYIDNYLKNEDNFNKFMEEKKP
ncbi:MAG: hypothetical protein KHX03_01380 [Clostridium sp.]|nr:hypothetical protein [Clostridium sp.]